MKIFVYVLILFSAAFFVSTVHADHFPGHYNDFSDQTQPPNNNQTQPPDNNQTQPPDTGQTQPPDTGQTQPPGGGAPNPFEPVQVLDPLGNTTIIGIFEAILEIIMVFAVPIVIFFIVYAGFLYVTARGNETQISRATKALTYAIVGGLLVLGARVLLAVITNTINAIV